MTNMDMLSEQDTRKIKYSEFLKINNHLPIYIQDWYLDLVCGNDNWDVSIVLKNDEVVAALPYYIKQNSLFKWIAMPQLSKMHGPQIATRFANGRPQHSTVNSLLEQLPSVAFYQQALNYSFKNWLPYLWNGYSQVTLYSYIFDDFSLDKVLTGMAPDYRRRIKKAEQDLVFTTDLSFDDFYRIVEKTYKRQNISMPFAYGFLKNYFDLLKRRGACEILFVSDKDGILHSVAMVIWDNRSAYYLIEGTDPDAPNKNAGIFIKWLAIKYTKQILKLNTFDFEGSISQRIEKIYREFGACAEPYYVIKKYHSKWFFALKFMQNLKQYGRLVQW